MPRTFSFRRQLKHCKGVCFASAAGRNGRLPIGVGLAPTTPPGIVRRPRANYLIMNQIVAGQKKYVALGNLARRWKAGPRPGKAAPHGHSMQARNANSGSSIFLVAINMRRLQEF